MYFILNELEADETVDKQTGIGCRNETGVDSRKQLQNIQISRWLLS
jgi:hypothetical protein